MKLATLKDGTRDGQLILVNETLTHYRKSQKWKTLQSALDHWKEAQKDLEEELALVELESTPLNQNDLHSPLPRAYQWLDGSAYVNHVELVRRARGVEMPKRFWTDPLMYQGGSDAFLAPHDDIILGNESWGCDFESEVAIITDDVPMGISTEKAKNHIALVMLVNDVSLRGLIPEELEKGFGFIHGKPASAFSPIALTLDELEDAWKDGKLYLPLTTTLNGSLFGRPNAGIDMTFNFAELIAHAAKTRSLSAGTIIGSGTVSNKDRSSGSSCLAEKRMLEIIDTGTALTPFLKNGDTVQIEMFNHKRKSLFGAIKQKVVVYA